jgi:galactose mutarotase-like enzyme
VTLELRSEPYPHWVFTAAGGDQLRVVPERGGLVTGWLCAGRERLYFDEQRFADPAKSVRGGIPVLFPICSSLPGNRLDLAEGSFAMNQHGFARDLPWQLTELADGQGIGQGIELTLGHSDATLAQYPFPFRLSLVYRLEPAALAVDVSVEHVAQGAGAMPFAFGLHPYFAVSGLESVAVQGLPATCRDQLRRLADGVDLLAEPAGTVRLWDGATGDGIELDLQAPLDQIVVWTDPPRPTVCVEPWTAPPGAVPAGDRCLWLEPGQSRQLRCRFRISALAQDGPAAADQRGDQ